MATSKDKQSQETAMTRSTQQGGLLRRYDPFGSREFFSASPFSLIRRMTEEMDRVFGDFGFWREPGEGSTWAPALEVAERGGKYIVHAELPGIKPEEVNVEVADDALIIQGERKSQHEETQGGVRRSERHYGRFYRAVPLPEGVNAEQVKASFKDGMLEVTIPMPPEQQQGKRRQVPIEGATEANPRPKTEPHG